MTRALLLAGGAALALLAASCGRSPPTVMLTIDAAPPQPHGVRGDYRGKPIVIPAVHVPAVLDHSQFASQLSAGTVKLDDFAQWAAPLGTLARDALVRDLTARLPAGAVLPPGAAGGPGTQVLDVTILSFTSGANGAILQVAYRSLPGGHVQQLDLHTSEPAADPAAAARALAALIGQLADAVVAGQPEPEPPLGARAS